MQMKAGRGPQGAFVSCQSQQARPDAHQNPGPAGTSPGRQQLQPRQPRGLFCGISTFLLNAFRESTKEPFSGALPAPPSPKFLVKEQVLTASNTALPKSRTQKHPCSSRGAGVRGKVLKRQLWLVVGRGSPRARRPHPHSSEDVSLGPHPGTRRLPECVTERWP